MADADECTALLYEVLDAQQSRATLWNNARQRAVRHGLSCMPQDVYYSDLAQPCCNDFAFTSSGATRGINARFDKTCTAGCKPVVV